MNNETIKLGNKEFVFTTDKHGNTLIDTGINVPLKTLCELTAQQASFDTYNSVLNKCKMIHDTYPKYANSIAVVMSSFIIDLDNCNKNLYEIFDKLLANEGYTVKDTEKLNLVIAVSYDTQNIILLKEVGN